MGARALRKANSAYREGCVEACRALLDWPGQSFSSMDRFCYGGTMWDRIQRLHEHHGDVPLEVRILKLTEEVGEVAEAFIGMRGLNRRKGVCRSREDLLDEIADVSITAAVAMSAAADNSANEAAAHLERRLDVLT